MSNILVTGGTGYLGRYIVQHLLERGHTVRIMSRSSQPADLRPNTEWAQAQLESGQGLTAAVQDCTVIVHAASNPQHSQQIDIEGTRRLLEVARDAGVAHFVYISIVGIDRVPFAYYKHKLAAEELIQRSGIPYSILRATQFHEFADLILRSLTKLPGVALIPTDFKIQPVAADEVAQRLCTLVETGPVGRAPDYGGPEVLTLGTMAHNWLAARGMRTLVIPLWLPGGLARSLRHGDNTCPDQPLHGQTSWQQWLQQHIVTAGDKSYALTR